MKLSINWLKDFVDIDVTKEELANKITFAGIEVEGASDLVEATNLVIGYVKEKEKHPNAEKLNVCKVDVGEEELQIVCGAPNVDQGQKVIVAKVGAILPGDFKIKQSKIRDVESSGMICSLGELGIENKFIPEDELDGIHVMNNDAPIGQNPIEYLKYNDSVLELDVLADRPDALSMYGLAYEVAAIYNTEVTLPETNYNTTESKDKVSLTVETKDCPVYYGRIVEGIEVKESPQFIKSRLVAAGIRPINNVVDITNYVLLEYGQPLHAFDKDKLGSNILVRNASAGEKITTLDAQERTLVETDIVITDGKKPQALGGVMGGLETEVEEATTAIILEAAVFNSQSIRKTSKRLGLRSDSSTRFEKGIDHNRTVAALDRACYLLTEYANAKVDANTASHCVIEEKVEYIELQCDKVRELLGVNIDDETIKNILSSLRFEFSYENGSLQVAKLSRRSDIQIKEDLIEEIGRLYGYDKIEGILPRLDIKTGGYSHDYRLTKDIRTILTRIGLIETVNYSLTKEDNVKMFTNDEFTPIKLLHPISEDKSTLRYSLIPSLVDVVKYNQARSVHDVNIFEVSTSYSEVGGEYVEKTNVSFALSGLFSETKWLGITKPADFYVAKGILETTFDYLGLNGRYQLRVSENAPKEFHPTRVAEIILQNKPIGYIGQVHPNVSEDPIYVCEFSKDKVLEAKVRTIKFKEIPKYPSMVRDLAVLVSKDVIVSDIVSVIKRNGGKLLVDVDVFDVYDGEKVEAGFQSIAFKLTYQDPNNTLTDDVVKASVDKILSGLEKKLNISIRQ